MDILNLLILSELWESLSINMFVSFFGGISDLVKMNTYFPKACYSESTGPGCLLPLSLSLPGAGSTGTYELLCSLADFIVGMLCGFFEYQNILRTCEPLMNFSVLHCRYFC